MDAPPRSRSAAGARGRGLGARAQGAARRRGRWPRSTRGKPVGFAGAYAFDLSIPGGELPCAGVTWVGVLPTHRRRGILRDFMRRQLDGRPGAGASRSRRSGRPRRRSTAASATGRPRPASSLKSDRARFALQDDGFARDSVRLSTPTRRSALPAGLRARPRQPRRHALALGDVVEGAPARRPGGAGGAARARSSTPPSRSTARSRATRSTASRTSGRTASPRARCA